MVEGSLSFLKPIPEAGILFRSGAKVTLFESEARPGGHTLTDASPGYPVDLGFQVTLTSFPRSHYYSFSVLSIP